MNVHKTLFSVLLWAVAAVSSAGDMPWAKSIADAQAQSKKTGKLLMLDFYTDW